MLASVAAAAQNRGFSSTAPQPSPAASNPSSSIDRGVPASVTSQSPRRSFISVAPGVTSFGSVPPGVNSFFLPNGLPPQCASLGPLIPSAMGCTDPRFTGGPVHLRPHFSQTVPFFVPYAYPVYVQEEPAPQEVQEPDPPAPTIFEHRARVAPPRPVVAAGAKPDSPSAAPEQSRVPEREQVPTILVYRDGHRTEVLNYAIVGQTLYDLGTFVAHKIPLSDLNLKATIQANEDQGVEFSLPASTKVE
jgi:hypothetical protein